MKKRSSRQGKASKRGPRTTRPSALVKDVNEWKRCVNFCADRFGGKGSDKSRAACIEGYNNLYTIETP
jgi:hypothetical protein